jgi:hypothetical protein
MACESNWEKEIQQMSKMYIRVKKDGFIYEYNEILAKNPECEIVPEEIAYPERFIPPSAAVRIDNAKIAAKTTTRKKKAALDLSTADIPEPPPYTSPELAAEAARGMP